MVKKFFRKIFKKKDPSEIIEEEKVVSSLDADESEPDIDESGKLDELSSDHLDEQGTDTFSVQELDLFNDEDDLTLSPDDLEDLPDLPPEVIKAIKENSSKPTFKSQNTDQQDLEEFEFNNDEDEKFEYKEEEEEEEFDFTEIKTFKKDPKTENRDEVPFDFNELKVDLPSDSHNIFQKYKLIITNLFWKIRNTNQNKSISTQAFLSPKRKSQAHYLFVTLFVVASCYYSGKTISYLLGGVSTSKSKSNHANFKKFKKSSELAKLEKLNPLGALTTAKKPDKTEKKEPKKIVINEKQICDKSSKKSSLNIGIETVIVLQDRVKSIASVQIRNKDQYVREGDKIDGMAIIGSINLDKVIFRNLKNGNCEYLEPPKKKKSPSLNKNFSKIKIHPAEKAKEFISDDPNIKVEGNKYKIDSSIRNDLMDNITDVLSQARAIQIKNSDGSLSFKIVEITPGSIYSKLNIQENDVITKINGERIENLNEIMSLFGRIKDLKSLDLGIERDGIENDFQYSFE